MTATDTVPPVVLTSYDEVWDAFRQRDLRQALYDAGGVVMADCLLDLHGDEHKARRRLENRLFRRGTFRWWEQHLVPGIIADALSPCVAAGRADLIQLGYRTTMNLTALVAGVDRPTGSVAETDALQHFAEVFSAGATLAHSTRDPAEVRAEVSAAMGRFDEMFVAPSIERRRSLLAAVDAGAADEGDLPRDVLTALLRNADALALTPDVVRRELAFYLQAGSHSTADLFTHAADDVFRWRREHPDDRRLADDRFLQACVHESLRLHPASPVAQRRALAEVALRSGRTLAAGDPVVLDVQAANRDRDVFGQDADRFDPDRTVPEGVPPWGHAFGGGMHVCIGMELDGGVVGRPGDDPAEQVLGTVTLMVRALLEAGAAPDPEHPPTSDPHSRREHFGSYPVIFGAR